MEATKTYTTELLKVSGLISETISLLNFWEPGMSHKELADNAVQADLLGKASASRMHDVVIDGFAKRYLRPDASAARNLKVLVEKNTELNTLRQLFFLYTCRSQPILRDMVCEVYWPAQFSGKDRITMNDVRMFIVGSFGTEKNSGRWAESIIAKLSNSIPKCLTDFGLLGPYKRSGREILPYTILNFTLNYILYDAHFKGLSDTQILYLQDWELFGLQPAEVLALIRNTAITTDAYIFQYAGDLARFTWKYETMENFLHAEA